MDFVSVPITYMSPGLTKSIDPLSVVTLKVQTINGSGLQDFICVTLQL